MAGFFAPHGRGTAAKRSQPIWPTMVFTGWTASRVDRRHPKHGKELSSLSKINASTDFLDATQPETFDRSPVGMASMRTALFQLGEDFLTAIVFVVTYMATGNLATALGIAIAVGIGQFALLRFTGRSIDVMQYLSVGLVIVLGGISLVFNDPRFVLLKPSAVHFAIAAVMLRRGWLARYMPPIVIQNVSEPVLTATGFSWAALMIALGALNIYIAMSFSIELWTWWISVGAIGAKLAALMVQFIVLRTFVRRNMRTIAQASP